MCKPRTRKLGDTEADEEREVALTGAVKARQLLSCTLARRTACSRRVACCCRHQLLRAGRCRCRRPCCRGCSWPCCCPRLRCQARFRLDAACCCRLWLQCRCRHRQRELQAGRGGGESLQEEQWVLHDSGSHRRLNLTHPSPSHLLPYVTHVLLHHTSKTQHGLCPNSSIQSNKCRVALCSPAGARAGCWPPHAAAARGRQPSAHVARPALPQAPAQARSSHAARRLQQCTDNG